MSGARPEGGLKLSVLPGRFAVCRLPPDRPAPACPAGARLWSLTRTADELSLVIEETSAPGDATVERGWRALEVAGPLDLASVGILAALAGALAGAGVSLFAISTHDTDLLLVREADLGLAAGALRESGHSVAGV